MLATQYIEKWKRLPSQNTKVKLMEQLLKRVIDSLKKVNKVKAVSFTERLNGIIDKYNDRSDDIVLADEIVTEVAKQLADLFEKLLQIGLVQRRTVRIQLNLLASRRFGHIVNQRPRRIPDGG